LEPDAEEQENANRWEDWSQARPPDNACTAPRGPLAPGPGKGVSGRRTATRTERPLGHDRYRP